jgi:hypothetical protein
MSAISQLAINRHTLIDRGECPQHGNLSRNASAVSDAPDVEWQVDFLEACGGASDTAV